MTALVGVFQALVEAGRTFILYPVGPQLVAMFVLGLMMDRTYKQPITALGRAILLAFGAWAVTSGFQALLMR